MDTFVSALIYGVTTGCLYAIVALGFTICFRAGGALNFAQGIFMVVAAYLAVGPLSGGHEVLGLVVAIVAMAALSGGGYLLGFRRFKSIDPVTITIVTMAASFVVQAVATLIWHGTIQDYAFPGQNIALHLFGNVQITVLQIVIMVLAPLVIFGIEAFFRFTRVGIRLRASSDSPSLAARSGIDVNKLYALAWGISGAMAGLGGGLFAATSSVNFSIQNIGLQAFPAAVLGGFGNIPGSFLGGLVLGLATEYAQYYVSARVSQVAPFIVMLIVLLVRPTGFFGDKRLARS